MSARVKWIADAIPQGHGWALDLGGGRGELCRTIRERGYDYVNLDLCPSGAGPAVRGDACAMPFGDATISMIVAKDALEHFENPWAAISEMRRILRPEGTLVLWVPFMHPFHSNDLYRYTPLALQKMLAGFRISRFETPLWVFSVLGILVIEVLKRLGFGFLALPLREIGWQLDRLAQRPRSTPRSFAGAYLIVGTRDGPAGTIQ